MTSYVGLSPIRSIGDDDLITTQARRKIFFNVLSGHVVFIIIPWIIFYIQFLIPREKIITVNLADFAPPQPTVQEKAAEPEKAPEPAPPEPAPEEPSIIPPPPDEPSIIPPPPPKEPQIKQPPLEKPKVVPPETAKKPEPQPPKSKYLKPEDIVKSSKVVQGKPQKNFTPISTSDLIKNIKNATAQPGPASTTGSTLPADYYDVLQAYLYRLWRQPIKAELAGALPKVRVSLSFDGSGNIKSARISSNSGNVAMDKSVNELLKNLKSVPAPPDGRPATLDVLLEIRDF